mmetsp:Transcript_12967/g.37648  ORF Transcript_12967/g.37648 Transcript_12967/m.37648 type:complete len:101 (-) Transcript_12967:1914-2216(-)
MHKLDNAEAIVKDNSLEPSISAMPSKEGSLCSSEPWHPSNARQKRAGYDYRATSQTTTRDAMRASPVCIIDWATTCRGENTPYACLGAVHSLLGGPVFVL